ncbi:MULTISPECIES: SH3 domain-containing protein [unclassified Mameliella]|nr:MULTISPECIES: SH3 domain-containing protein [unclassified Mameliella]
MIVRGTMLMTFLLLGVAWWQLSGGSDFEPGEHGVTILADVRPSTPQVRPLDNSLTARRPDPAPEPAAEPRVSSLAPRDPLPSKTVRAPEPEPEVADPASQVVTPAPEAASPDPEDEIAAALADAIVKDNTPPPAPDAAEPADELARSLADALGPGVIPESVGPEDPIPQIAGLGDGAPLGSRVGDGAAPVVAPDERDLRIVTGTRVNLRDGPATSYDVITQLFEGDEVEVLDDTGDGWVRLRVLSGLDEATGWMSDDFLEAAD